MPSRRNRAPISPGTLQASAALRMRVRSALVNWRRRAMAATSGSGGATGDAFPVDLRAPSNASPIAGETSAFIGSLDSLDMIQDYLSCLLYTSDAADE